MRVLHKRYKVFLCIFTNLLIGLLYISFASAGSATLSWYPPLANEDGTPLIELAGYKIYYGTASQNYSDSIDVGNVTTFTIPNLSEGVTYYFAVTAYNTSQKESKYSNEASKIIPLLQQKNLTVNKNGTGTGVVTSSPAGISCGVDCAETYNTGTSVTLSALPDGNSVFTGWSGACSGIGICTVTMDATRSIDATFTMKSYTIKATAGMGGKISPSGSVVVNHGATQVFSITAYSGYTVAKVLVDGEYVGAIGTYTFSDVSANHTISAKFANLSDGTIAEDYFIFIPVTGQTISYTFGDDGDIKAGMEWPEPRFVDNGDGTVTDTLTGLMWLKDGGCLKKRNWSDALVSIIEMNANPERYSCEGYSADYTDWRMPNIREMESLINYGEPDSSVWLDTGGFTNINGSWYWSSTTNINKPNKAYAVNMTKTKRKFITKKKKTFVIPVRGMLLSETE